MKRGAWTADELAYLRARYADQASSAIATALDRPVSSVYARANSLGLKKSAAFLTSAASGRLAKGNTPPTGETWKDEDVGVVRARYANEKTAAIAASIGRSAASVYKLATKLGLEKSETFNTSEASGRLRSGDGRGTQTRFKKGQRPWIAGKKGVSAGGVATQFKKGQRAHNHVAIGTEVMASIGYLKRKVAEPNVWQFVHILAWEAANGQVPEGSMLRFRDGNRLNCAIENLECVTKQEHMARVTIHRFPAEVRQVIRLQGRLKRLIEERSDEKQD